MPRKPITNLLKKIGKDNYYEPSDKEKKVIKLIAESRKMADEFQADIFAKLMRFYYLYRGYQQETTYPWRNNLCLPIAFSNIETIFPRIVLNQPKIILTAIKDSFKKYLKPSQAYLEYELENDDAVLEIWDWFKRALIYGTSVLKLTWHREKQTAGRVKKNGKTSILKKSITKEGPIFCAKEPFDFKIDDPGTSYIKHAEFVIDKYYTPKRRLNLNKKFYNKNLKYVKNEVWKDDFTANKYVLNELDIKERGRVVEGNQVSNGSEDNYSKQRRGCVKIEEFYFKRSNKYPLGRLIIIANGRIPIYNNINPYWYVDGEFPFIEIKDNLVPGEFYAQGEIEPIESLIYEKNHIRNRRLDSSEQTADKMWRVDPDSEVDESELVWMPNGIVHAEAGEVDVLESGDVATTSFKEEGMVEKDIEYTIGISGPTRGIGEKYQAATSLVALIAETNQKFALKIKQMGEMGMKRMCKMLLQLAEANATQNRLGRILGGERIVSVDKQDISSDFDVQIKIDPNPFINKAMIVEQLTKVASVIMADPSANHQALEKMLLSEIGVTLAKKDIDEILNKAKKTDAFGGNVPGFIKELSKSKPGGSTGMKVSKAGEDVQSGVPVQNSQPLAGEMEKTMGKLPGTGLFTPMKKIPKK